VEQIKSSIIFDYIKKNFWLWLTKLIWYKVLISKTNQSDKYNIDELKDDVMDGKKIKKIKKSKY